jgi:5-methylthioribose kinase
MVPEKKKELVRRYINPELCRITELLVYTDPYTNFSGRNKVFPANKEFVERELYGDAKLLLEVAKLKNAFKNNAQALIHGDLHTGSIFVKRDSTRVFDPEFAFYGPIGYDVGNVIANLFFAWANARVTLEGREQVDYLGWLEQTISDVVDLFAQKAMTMLLETASDPMAKVDGFLRWYMASILADTAGVAGLEMNRRTVGSAQVKDLTSIEGVEARAAAERVVMLSAKHFILHRGLYTSGSMYVETVKTIAKEVMK